MITDSPELDIAIQKIQEENDFLVNRVETLKQERDRLTSQVLLQD